MIHISEISEELPRNENILGYEKIGKLIPKFAIPAIVGMVVNAVYNMIDQVLIGWSDIGMLGIGATTVSFPITSIMTALGLLLSAGCAANFSINLGRGDKAKAGRFAGTAISLGAVTGISLFAIAIILLKPMLVLFGSTEAIMPYAIDYTFIIIFGIPFGILTNIFSTLIRADGNPRYSMVCSLTGAIFNLIFDPMVLFIFKLGLKGIAFTTSFGMVITAVMGGIYVFKSFRAVRLTLDHLRVRFEETKAIVSLGIASLFNHIAMTISQIIMNNTLRTYGSLSVYGSDAIIACVGSISKFAMVFGSVNIGIGQGCQPIIGFNYGAKQYGRIKQTYRTAIAAAVIFSTAVFLTYQIFPRQILMLYGNNPDAFYDFGTRYLRIFMFMTFANCVQPITANFFTSIGKARKGLLVSMTRQILLLIPLLLILPLFLGVDGILFAGPISDFFTVIIALALSFHEIRHLTQSRE